MCDFILRFVSDESGATAIEYGLIIGGLCLAIVAAINGVATAMSANFDAISAEL